MSTAELVPVQKEQRTSADVMLSVIAEAALNPQVDAAKMRDLWEIKKDIDARDAEIAFNQAMKAAQDEMRPVVRTAENKQTNSKYAKLEHVDKAIKPIYVKHGFSLSFNSDVIEQGKVMVSCLCMHTAGHSKAYSLPGPLDIAGLKGTSNKTEMHALGSSLSYLKRYLKCMIFDVTLTDEDDDGNGGPEALIDLHQKNQILDLLAACEDKWPDVHPAFLKFMGVKAVSEIPARQFDLALNQLQAKAKVARAGK